MMVYHLSRFKICFQIHAIGNQTSFKVSSSKENKSPVVYVTTTIKGNGRQL